MKPFKKGRKGEVPAVVLYDPKYPHNVGEVLRACSCFDITQLWITGTRMAKKVWEGKRIPREERLRGFREVEMLLDDEPLKFFPKGVVPVAVELLKGAENMYAFEHPENAVYIFGPEDGTLPQGIRRHCHRRLFIPTRHCVNLNAAVHLVLNDRKYKQYLAGQVPLETIGDSLREQRGWANQGRKDDYTWESNSQQS